MNLKKKVLLYKIFSLKINKKKNVFYSNCELKSVPIYI